MLRDIIWAKAADQGRGGLGLGPECMISLAGIPLPMLNALWARAEF